MIPKFVFIETSGCSANLNNSEIMKGLIKQAGLDFVDNPEMADILILNTCIVKEPTEKEMERRISELLKLNKPLIITGCMPAVRKEKLRQNNIFLLPSNNIKSILKLIRKISEKSYGEKDFMINSKEEKLLLPKQNDNRKIGITQILEGCQGSCTYCITRFAKGSLFSYSEDKIIGNIKRDLEQGCKEIWLTSQDNASYGLDKNKISQLPSLLKKILSLEGNFRIRLGMMNPNNILPILDELTECYKDEKMFKFLHIPLQSGSDKVLKDMNRHYQVKDFLFIINKFKKEIPGISFATDIIVAYPTEKEDDFKKSLDIINNVKPDMLNLSAFWPMKGTPAYNLKQLPREVAKKRTTEMMQEFRKIADENNKARIGKVFSCLVYDSFKDNYLSHAEDYKLVRVKSDKNILGKIIKLRITKQEQMHLVGESV